MSGAEASISAVTPSAQVTWRVQDGQNDTLAEAEQLLPLSNQDVISSVLDHLGLRDKLNLALSCKDFDLDSIWTLQLQQWKRLTADLGNPELPLLPFPAGAKTMKQQYIHSQLSQKSLIKDICHLGDKQRYTIMVEGEGEFGICGMVRTACWMEFQCSRLMPAGAYDLILRMKWANTDFLRVERPTYDCSFNPIGDLQATEVLRYAVTPEDNANLQATVGKWVLLNFGTVRCTVPGRFHFHYIGHCPYWFGGWYLDWLGFFPPGLVPTGISLSKPPFGPDTD